MLVDSLEQQWTRRRLRAWFPTMTIVEPGLMLGAETKLAAISSDPRNPKVSKMEVVEDEVVALLSAAFQRRIAPHVVTYVKESGEAFAERRQMSRANRVGLRASSDV